ncbi:MAG: hypothetical protein CMH54_12660 [Myxococcales bacterium]|nr:hypothetical protein [Myxococcales bacterium]|tara:strand:+ start:113 stop:2815 length:2703 start_codon:yes stop_codon:yes gene_type:complete
MQSLRNKPLLPWIALYLVVMLGCGGGDTSTTDAGVTPDVSEEDPGTSPDVATPDVGEDLQGSDGGVDLESSDIEEDVSVALPGDFTIGQELLPDPANFVLRGVFGADSSTVWAVGQDGVVLRRANNEWSIESFGMFPYLHGIDGNSSDNMLAVGMFGTRVTGDGSIWIGGDSCDSDLACEDGDSCTVGVCIAHECQYFPQVQEGCCGMPVYTQTFDESGAETSLDIVDLATLEGGGIVWHTSTARANSAPSSMYFGHPSLMTYDNGFCVEGACVSGNPAACVDTSECVGSRVSSSMTLPDIHIPNSASASLDFSLFMAIESTGGFDEFRIDVESQGSTTTVWDKTQVTGFTGNTVGFVDVSVDLTNYSNQTVTISFVFDSIDYFLNSTEGVYVDDLVLNSECSDPSDGTDDGEDMPSFFDVAALPNGRFIAVGLNGAIWGYDETFGWQDMATTSKGDWYAAHTTGDHTMLGGAEGRLLERNGEAISSPQSGTTRAVQGVHVFADGSRIAVGDDGLVLWSNAGEGTYTELSNTPSSIDLMGVAGQSPDDVTIVGKNGTSWRWDGESFTVESTGVSHDLHGVVVLPDGYRVAIGAMGTIIQDEGTGWTEHPKFTNDGLNAIYAVDKENIFIIGDYGTIVQWDIPSLSFKKKQSPISKNMKGIFAFAADNVWAVGLFGTIIHFNGTEWAEVETALTADLYDVTGTESGDLILVGVEGSVLRKVGDEFYFLLASTSNTLRAVYALDDNHVWAVGSLGTIMFFDGNIWSRQQANHPANADGEEEPITESFYSVWGAAPDDVWAFGDGGRLVHYDGQKWSRVTYEDPHLIRSLTGWSNDAVLGVGSAGYAAYFDGSLWHPIDTGTVATLHDIVVVDDTTAIAVGDAGTVLTFRRPIDLENIGPGKE